MKHHASFAILAALALLGVVWEPGNRAYAQTIALAPGQARELSFQKQVTNIKTESADPRIVLVESRGDRVVLRAVKPGKTTVTITGEVVTYQAGPGTFRNDQPFSQQIFVLVTDSTKPSQTSLTAHPQTQQEMTSLAAGRTIIVLKVGEKRTNDFPKQVIGVQVENSDRLIVDAQYREGYGVTITGISPGRAIVNVSGEIVRYFAGINAPLGETEPFTQTLQIEVVAPAKPLEWNDEITLKVGETHSFTIDKKILLKPRVDRSNPAIVQAELRGDRMTITATKVGQTTVTLRGEMADASNVAGQNHTPISGAYQVTVVPSSRVGEVYRRTRTLLQSAIFQSQAATRQLQQLLQEARTVPLDSADQMQLQRCFDQVRDGGTSAQGRLVELEKAFSAVQKGKTLEAVFLNAGYEYNRQGLADLWVADRCQAGAEVKVLAGKFSTRANQLWLEYQKEEQTVTRGGIPRGEEGKRLNERLQKLKATERGMYDETLNQYQTITSNIVAQRGRLAGEAWRWFDLANQQKLTNQAPEAERFVYQQFEYDLNSTNKAALRKRLWGYDTPQDSQLDFFVNVSGSDDRLVLGFGLLTEEADHVKTLNKMNAAFEAAPLEKYREKR